MSTGSLAPSFDFESLRNDTSTEEYGRFQGHLFLIEDRQRIARYAEAISRFPPGRVIVDVGAGTGVLAFIGLKHGFERAYLIEPSRKMAAYARHLAQLNGLSDRITIVSSTLEGMDPAAVPSKIDLVVTETISSVLFGFGSWDRLSFLADRLETPDAIVPLSGRLYACLAFEDYVTQTPLMGGEKVLRELGLNVDLAEHTFRPGGNVIDERNVQRKLSSGELIPTSIAEFDFRKRPALNLDGARLPAPMDGECCGIVLFWAVTLTEKEGIVRMTSVDPDLRSWRPFYVPFVQPRRLSAGESVTVRMSLLPIDVPYKYATQFVSDDGPLSRVLYW